jgi:anti-sigma regulatory factor (Ser/Thr protein kinase)
MQSVNESFSDRYEADPESVAQARGDLGAFAAAAGASTAQVADVRLAVSEAVTNAVLHGYRGERGDVHVTGEVVGDALCIEVRDTGSGMRPRPAPPPARPGMGLGLGLIAQIVDELTVASPARGGTRVGMRFELGAAGDPPHRAVAA